MARYETHCFSAIDHRFIVELDDPRVGQYLDFILAGLRESACDGAASPGRYRVSEQVKGSKTRYHLDWQGERLATRQVLESVIRYLLWHINRYAVKCSQQHLLIHAAAVDFSGQGILLPGSEEVGKTTLAAALVKRGFGYLTDETVALRAGDRRMLAYAKPFSLDRGSWIFFSDLADVTGPDLKSLHAEQWQIPAGALQGGGIVPSAPVNHIVAPRYVRGAVTRIEPLSRAETVRALAEHAFNFRGFPRGLELLARTVRPARGHRLTVGSLADACDLVERLVMTGEDSR